MRRPLISSPSNFFFAAWRASRSAKQTSPRFLPWNILKYGILGVFGSFPCSKAETAKFRLYALVCRQFSFGVINHWNWPTGDIEGISFFWIGILLTFSNLLAYKLKFQTFSRLPDPVIRLQLTSASFLLRNLYFLQKISFYAVWIILEPSRLKKDLLQNRVHRKAAKCFNSFFLMAQLSLNSVSMYFTSTCSRYFWARPAETKWKWNLHAHSTERKLSH